jgi:hypothetical protein
MSAAAPVPILKELSPSRGFYFTTSRRLNLIIQQGTKRSQEENLFSPSFSGFKYVRVVISKLLWSE